MEDDEPDSGPFCIHWADPTDCDELCNDQLCNHQCCNHPLNGPCVVNGCNCTGFKEPK